MTYAFTQDVPIDPAIYDQIRAELGDDPPRGMLAHVVIRTEEGLRYVDVWESEEDASRFIEERLHPVVGRVLTRVGFARPASEPPRHRVEVVDVWAPRG